MKHAVVVALDQGTHASRASAWQDDGQCVATASRLVDCRREGTRVEQSPGALLASLQAVIAEVADKLSGQQVEVVSVGLATQRSSALCWRRSDGEPLTPVLSWQDTRAAAALQRHRSRFSAIRAETGLYPNAHLGASKLAWCLEQVPEVSTAARCEDLVMGPLSSWVVQRLCRLHEPWVDPSNGSRTLLMDRNGCWSSWLHELFGIERSWLPAALDHPGPSGARLAATGWSFGLCTGDQAAVPFGTGLEPREVVGNLGSGGFLLRHAEADETADPRLLEGLIWREGGTVVRTLEGTVNGAAAALQWHVALAGGNVRDFDQWLATDSVPALFLNTVSGLGSPDWRGGIEPAFRPGAAEPAAQRAAVVESILFLVKRNFEHLDVGGPFVVSGGLASSARLCRRLADLLGRTVIRPDAAEATSRGVADRLWRQRGGLPRPAALRFEPRSNPALNGRYRAWTSWLEDTLLQAE